VIALYRRHQAGCKLTSRKKKNCRCPIWAEGTIHGEKVRRSLDLRDWEAAVRLTREWEIHKPENTVSVADAAERFIADAKARNLREGSILKYEQSVKMLKEKFGERLLRTVTVDDIRTLRESWKISGTTMQKRLETVKAFFRFCADSGWIQASPAKAVKAPVVKRKPTMPFTDDDIEKILAAVEDKYAEKHPASPDSTRVKIRAFILVMLYSGIRISDCVFLRKERIKDDNLFLYTHKTGVAVRVPMPAITLNALKDCGAHDFYF
jgi:site-specific recombinase XerD